MTPSLAPKALTVLCGRHQFYFLLVFWYNLYRMKFAHFKYTVDADKSVQCGTVGNSPGVSHGLIFPEAPPLCAARPPPFGLCPLPSVSSFSSGHGPGTG